MIDQNEHKNALEELVQESSNSKSGHSMISMPLALGGLITGMISSASIGFIYAHGSTIDVNNLHRIVSEQTIGFILTNFGLADFCQKKRDLLYGPAIYLGFQAVSFGAGYLAGYLSK